MTAAAAGELPARHQSRHRLTGAGGTVLGLLLAVLPLTFAGAGPLASASSILVVLAVAAVMVVGVVWPSLAVRRATVEVRSPADATVGEAVPLTVTVRGGVPGLELRVLDPSGPWHRLPDGEPAVVDHVARQRGVFQHLRVEVRTTVPLGLFSAQRVFLLQLPSLVAVAPVPLSVDWRPGPAPVDGRARAGGLAAPAGDLVRTVRPYAAGDPLRLVHWPSTARTGALVVRELEPPAPQGQAVVLDLTDLGERADEAAAYALGACAAVLGAGGALVLCTHDLLDGPVATEVRSLLAARRRIAAAITGPPGAPPARWPLVEIGR
ncbi:MAG: DUF58 domain-containing protein [Actinobacteria bacterium]|nr:DUF58 domain-containing protein [Actinomycetota bacterium]